MYNENSEDIFILQALLNWEILFINNCVIKLNKDDLKVDSILKNIKLLITFKKTLEEKKLAEIEEALLGENKRKAFGKISMYVSNLNKEKIKNYLKYKIYCSCTIKKMLVSERILYDILKNLATLEHIYKIYKILEKLTKNINGKAELEEKHTEISEIISSGCASFWLLDIQNMYKYAIDFYKNVDSVVKIQSAHNYPNIWSIIIKQLKELIDTLCSKLLDSQVNNDYRINGESLLHQMKNLKPKILNSFLEKYSTPQLESTFDNIPIYSFTSEVKLLIIIKNVNYEDNDVNSDINLLKKLFLQLGFEVRVYENLTKQDMVNIFAQVQQQHLSCFMLIVMGFGNNVGIRSIDGIHIPFPNIVSFFDNKCTNLLNKPKMFIFSTCGSSLTTAITEENQLTYEITDLSDILITYATMEESKRASQFIKIFCKIFKDNAAKKNIEEILKIAIQKAMKENIKPPIYKNFAFKNCYLLPEETS